VKDTAARLNIKLYFIPPGMTDAFQPLDRKVFGVLKAYAKRLFLQSITRNPGMMRTKSDAAHDLVTAWSNSSVTTIEEAWNISHTSE
jgi:hypothetical protein